MLNQQIFPKEIVDQCIETHRYRNLKKSKSIYIILIVATVVLLSVTPFVYIDLYAHYPGMIKSKTNVHHLLSPVNGNIKKIYVENNQKVTKGQALIAFDMTVINQQISAHEKNLDSVFVYIRDLELLLSQHRLSVGSMESELYKITYQHHLQNLVKLKRKHRELTDAYKRQQLLYQKGVIAKADFLTSKYRWSYSKDQISLFLKNQLKDWHFRLRQLHEQKNSLTSFLVELNKQKELHVVRAATSGTIRLLNSTLKGNVVGMGSQLASISPNSALIVECYVTSEDIGVLNKKVPISYQVDSFNHHYWGSASGNFIQVDPEISRQGAQTIFKVLCSLDQTELMQKNKKKGELINGMTLKARFYIDRRSIFQLLF